MNKEFIEELKQTGYIHSPLPLHREGEAEADFCKKKITASKTLYGASAQITPVNSGRGVLEEITDGGAPAISISASLRIDKWPEGTPPYGEYCNFGEASITLPIDGESWEKYNRLHFWVKPIIPAAHVASLNAAVENKGKIAVPDVFRREGETVFDLDNNEWNECFWEFSSMARDKITQLRFYVFLSGHDSNLGNELTYLYKDVTLEHVEAPEQEKGWQPQAGHVSFSTVGYWPHGVKTALASTDAASFSLLDADSGSAVFTADVKQIENDKGRFGVLDFTKFTKCGRYRLSVGDVTTESFEIDDNLAEESVWRVVNFLFCERCGTAVPGKHGICHQDVIAEHNGVKKCFAGGWHDAGDVSQQMEQTAEITHSLFETASRLKRGTALYNRVLEEAQWGLAFVLNSRFGDGYRATSMPATRWTDNMAGNMDDIPVRVHNHSFENFVCAGVEAFAAEVLTATDSALAHGSLEAAKADYAFACEVFEKTGVDPAEMYEHTFNSGLSQYYAAIIWAASCLYSASGDEKYALDAAGYAEKLIACQESGAAGLPFKGFFYRDETHSAIVHFNHQSRAQQFMQALVLLCETQPDNPALPKWQAAIRSYGEYLKAMRGVTYPYGMQAAGVFKTDEPEDEKTFSVCHVATTHEREKQNYIEQLKAGTPVADGYVTRAFPVWFSFKGNNAVLLAEGKGASLAGRYLNDDELLQIGREQLYWVWGKNPFCQTLLYGAGSRWCRQYAVLPGEMSGEIPVGIETYENEDIPYWPQNNNATFREVWTSSACRWLWLAADFIK